jgi:tetratricopeptide (TPR) repeat protein
MLCKNENYELYMGYANILYNRYKYDLAKKAYQKVIKLKPSLINANVAMMFLHEFKRVEKPKALSYAQLVL